jgi:hypothetical protein
MTITWHTADDDRVCPICLPLDEYTWTYDTERDAFPTYLHHPQLGIIVWDVQADEPRPHGHHRLNCRCTLEVTFKSVAPRRHGMSLSTSLAEARQLYALLGDIERQLDTTKAKSRDTELVFRDLYNVMQDVFALLRHAGLPEDQARALAFIQRMITSFYSLYVAANTFNIAMSGTPAGLIMAGLGYGASLLTIFSGVGSYG